MGKWSIPKPVIAVDTKARCVSVSGRNGRENTIAFEDLRSALPNNSLAQLVQDRLDSLNTEILDRYKMESAPDNINVTPDELNPVRPSSTDADFGIESSIVEPSIGENVSVYWSLDKVFYPGTFHSEEDDGHLNIHYDDGGKECLDMTKEVWKYTESLSASSSTLTPELELKCAESDVLSSMVDYFGNKPFFRHQVQGFDQYVLFNSYQTEEETFLNTVRPFPHNKVLSDANIISSHTLYKVKMNDDGSLKMKARIAPHGNEEEIKILLAKTVLPAHLLGFASLSLLHHSMVGHCTKLTAKQPLFKPVKLYAMCMLAHQKRAK